MLIQLRQFKLASLILFALVASVVLCPCLAHESRSCLPAGNHSAHENCAEPPSVRFDPAATPDPCCLEKAHDHSYLVNSADPIVFRLVASSPVQTARSLHPGRAITRFSNSVLPDLRSHQGKWQPLRI